MMVIWKFHLSVSGTGIHASENWKPLHVGMQDGLPMLWAMVDPHARTVCHYINCVGTGHDTDFPPHAHLGTVQVPPFVWHFFWVRP